MKFLSIIALMLCISTPSFSQDGKDSSPTQNGSSANSGSTSTATINNITQPSLPSHQFIGALPGTTGNPGPFPGFPLESGKWDLYKPYVSRVLTMDEVNSASKNRKKAKTDIVVLDANAVPPNDDPIHVVGWWPINGSWNGDRVISSINVRGDTSWSEYHTLAVALRLAKEKSHTRRVAIAARVKKEVLTTGKSIGGSATFGRVIDPSNDNDVLGVAAGGMLGKNRVSVDERFEFWVLCLNDGPYDPPAPPERSEPKAPPAPLPQPKAEEKLPIPVVQAEEKKIPQDECAGMPDFVVIFDLDQSVIKEEYRSKIKMFADWLLQHSGCTVQVEGHASPEASYDYNAGLGRRRSKAVYELLIVFGGSSITDSVKQFVSVSKDRQMSDYYPENRRVIVRVIGHASGK